MIPETRKAKIRNRIVSALAELKHGKKAKAERHLRGALMIMDDDLETMFCNGINVCPPDGEYKVYIDNVHLLTKKIKNSKGSNHLPWLTEIPLFSWSRTAQKYNLPTGDFLVHSCEEEKCCMLDYKDGHIKDKVVQVRGLPNTWAGMLYKNNEFCFWFKMVKVK